MNNSCFKVFWLSGYIVWGSIFRIDARAMVTHRQNTIDHGTIHPLVAQKELMTQCPKAFQAVYLEQDQPSDVVFSGLDKDTQPILEEYDTIKHLYAYDPVAQKWLPIKDFQIVKAVLQKKVINMDWTVYTDFWAYNDQHEWFKVSLMKFLKQHYHDRTSNSLSLDKDNTHILDRQSYTKEYGRKDFLEELLTKEHETFGNKYERNRAPHFSCHISVGIGGLFVENKLKNIGLICRNVQDYFLITPKKVYQPFWFVHALYDVKDFQAANPLYMEQPSFHAGFFKGNGIALPVTFGLAYHFNQRFLIGLGKEMVLNRLEQLHYYKGLKKACNLIVAQPWFAQSRWFMQGGYRFVQYAKHILMADIRLLWVHHVGNKWRQILVPYGYIHQTIAYNIGLTHEQHLTDHLILTTRLAVEYQSFQEFDKSSSFNIFYRQPAIYVQSGFSIQF